jgi:hypothetical protein
MARDGGNVWDLELSNETATGQPVPVTADGQLVATLTPLWAAGEGVRVDLDYTLGDALTERQALALSDALRQVASIPGPDLT